MLVADQQADGEGAATVNPSPHWLALEVSVYYDSAERYVDDPGLIAGS